MPNMMVVAILSEVAQRSLGTTATVQKTSTWRAKVSRGSRSVRMAGRTALEAISEAWRLSDLLDRPVPYRLTSQALGLLDGIERAPVLEDA